MDVALSERQEMIKQAARSFFQQECPRSTVREIEASGAGYSAALWKKLAGLGWLGITYPKEFGGEEASLLDTAMVYEEMGRSLFPGPHLETVIIGGELILALGTTAHRWEHLNKIREGELLVSVVLPDMDSSRDAGIVAEKSGAEWLLDGRAFVPYASIANLLLCAAQTGARRSDVTVFALDPKSRGISITPCHTMSGDNLCQVAFDNVAVPDARVVGEVGKAGPGLGRVVERATVLHCARMAGACEPILDMAVQYAKERVQFGKQIGQFQGVQWLCVDIASATHIASLLTRQAAWLIDNGEPHRAEVAAAKAYISDALQRAARSAHEVFAGVSFIVDHDLQLYTRRAKAWETYFGDARRHRSTIAEALKL